MLDMELVMVEQFHWPLREIDRTDVERILEFVLYFLYRKRQAQEPDSGGRAVYADEADWL